MLRDTITASAALSCWDALRETSPEGSRLPGLTQAKNKPKST